MKNILLATDLASNSDRAMERAVELAHQNKAKLHVIHVVPEYKHRKLSSSLIGETRDLIQKYIADCDDCESLNTVIHVVQSSSPYQDILEYSNDIAPDLIIMGMHGKAKFQDLFIGTTVERVVRLGVYPVLMVKNKSLQPYKTVIAGIDFSPSCREALRTSMGIAPDAFFELIYCHDLPAVSTATPRYAVHLYGHIEVEQEKELVEFANTELKYFESEHKESSERINFKMVHGKPYKQLVKQAKKMKADLITIGAHGRSVLMPAKFGGVAEEFFANPPCDILVVRGKL